MQIHIVGHNFHVTPAIEEFIKEKFNKLKKHSEQITSINVTLNVEKLQHIAESTIFLMKFELHAHAESHNMYTTIDQLVEKLNVQLIKHKEKLQSHR